MAEVTTTRPPVWRSVLERIEAARRGDSSESLAAVFVLAATVIALLWANSPWGWTYDAFWDIHIAITVGDAGIDLDLQHWVNDGLMALFFFVIGLEVKREFAMGELRDRSKAAVPLAAAVAGLVLPALLYLLLNPSGAAASAWGVVISTDTAFLLGALAVVGPGRAERLRIFLLTLAVADDVGALAVIAVVYTDELHVVPLAVGVLGLLAIWQLRRLRVWRGGGYLIVSLVTWVAFYESGVHATLAGVLIALLLPVYPPKRALVERAAALTRAFRQSPNPEYARTARLGLERAVSVNERLMRLYQPYAAFLIVPVFALANAGVPLTAETLRASVTSPLTWGIVIGLVVGKFVGISGATALFSPPPPRQPRPRPPHAPGRGRRGAVGDRVHDLAVHRRPRPRRRTPPRRRGAGRRARGVGAGPGARGRRVPPRRAARARARGAVHGAAAARWIRTATTSADRSTRR